MKFTVPQFIEVEDKVLGPLTVRQFLIMLVTFGFMFVAYKLFDFTLFIFVAIAEFGIGGTLAFWRVNGQPFHFFLLNLTQTTRRPRLRLWDKSLTDAELKVLMKEEPPPPPKRRLIKAPIGTSKLAQLSLIVNTGGIYNPDAD